MLSLVMMLIAFNDIPSKAISFSFLFPCTIALSNLKLSVEGLSIFGLSSLEPSPIRLSFF